MATLFTTTTGGNHTAVSSTLIGFVFIKFLGLFVFKVLSIFKFSKKINAVLRKRRGLEDDWEPYEQAALLREAESDSDSEEQEIERPQSMESFPTYGY